MKKITKITILFAVTQFVILVCLCFVKLWFVIITMAYGLIIPALICEILNPICWDIKSKLKKYEQKQAKRIKKEAEVA